MNTNVINESTVDNVALDSFHWDCRMPTLASRNKQTEPHTESGAISDTHMGEKSHYRNAMLLRALHQKHHRPGPVMQYYVIHTKQRSIGRRILFILHY